MRLIPPHAVGLSACLALCGPVAAVAGVDEGQVLSGDGMAVAVPSGIAVTLQDVIWNVPGPEGLTLRFRFIAPAIAEGADLDAVSADMQHLCDAFALPRVPEFDPRPEQIVISVAAAPVAFGETAPDVVQFFESFRIEDGACQWELF
jgi:hypothetical protein